MKTFSQTDVDAMTEAARLLKLGPLTVVVDEEWRATSISVDGFQIEIEEGEREDMSLTGIRTVTCIDYVVYAENYSPGTYWEPPDVDIEEVARENSPTNAIGAIARIVCEQQIQNVLEGIYWNHYHIEGENEHV